MKMKDKLIGAGAVLLAFGGIGTVASFASASTPPAVHAKASVKEPVSATDTDTTQQGDQTTPDVPGAVETPDPNEKADTPTAGDTADSGTETKDATESTTASDGPGGHADPPGQVDNQQDGNN